jgi:hypothetical protein
MMKAAEDWQRDDLALDGALRGHRGLLAEPLVRACAVVVADVLDDDAFELPVVEHEDVIETLATQRIPRARDSRRRRRV